jgi:predicted ribosome quality control (RQC) complex YloA/Tae2 family protein
MRSRITAGLRAGSRARHISRDRDRFRLGGPNAARTKVKRAGWTWEPPNHPADPLRIRVPRDAWEEAAESPHRNPRHVKRERHDRKAREPTPHEQNSRNLNGFEMALEALQHQLERERSRADAAEGRVQELTADLDKLRERMTELREARAAADARTEAAEARVDDLMVQVQRLAETEARAGLLQIEADRSRAEAERLRAEIAAAGARPAKPRWFRWRRRGGADSEGLVSIDPRRRSRTAGSA